MNCPRRSLIEKRFHITGTGTVVVIGETTGLPVGRALRATIIRPDSSKRVAGAVSELGRKLPRTRQVMGDKPDEFFLSSEAIADSVLGLVRQDRPAWTFELDLRPFGEKW